MQTRTEAVAAAIDDVGGIEAELGVDPIRYLMSSENTGRGKSTMRS